MGATLKPVPQVSPERGSGRGFSVVTGQVSMVPARGDGLLTTAESARLVRRSPATIRSWRNRGWLAPQGLDEHNRPLHSPEAVRAAERTVRANGLTTSGIDPRQLCHHTPAAA